MEMKSEKFLELMNSIFDGVVKAEQEAKIDWHPDEPPMFSLFSAVGFQIAEDFDSLGESTKHAIFSLIEDGMRSEDMELTSAVATGLMESLMGRAARVDGLWSKISPLLGSHSMHHAEIWMNPDKYP